MMSSLREFSWERVICDVFLSSPCSSRHSILSDSKERSSGSIIISVIFHIYCNSNNLLKGYTIILFLISGDRKMNSMQLTQPWPVKVIACIKSRQQYVLCHARRSQVQSELGLNLLAQRKKLR